MTTDQIKEIVDIQEYLECTYDSGNPAELLERLTNLNVYLARTADILPFAEEELNMRKGEIARENRRETATLLRYIIDCDAAIEQRFYKHVERINAAIVHQIDAIRTQLSYVKMTMQLR